MGNILTTLKRFFGDKNTVTIIGVILGIIILYVGYTWRVNQAISPVTVPSAAPVMLPLRVTSGML